MQNKDKKEEVTPKSDTKSQSSEESERAPLFSLRNRLQSAAE